ncbi:MAG: trypsin-like peptidase domain-containing protein [Planctomycetes bacterium]|nr:trypsin-like peptidase domain-containing protein [Planctomycetota bacterium]
MKKTNLVKPRRGFFGAERWLVLGSFLVAVAAGLFISLTEPTREAIAQDGLKGAKATEADRIKVINKVKPSVVAVYARGGGGGGSGVVIDKEGYALTNFHVVQPTGPTMVCGLPNGVLYDAVLVGMDKVGDIALIKLIPKKPGDTFEFAEMGNSDDVKAGDWSLAMGNPFLLATDFTPSVSYGLISGVNRYQYPSGGFLEYTDCIQFDTTINPGNSGGPLFSMKGELIGINGRGSFAQDKRFRINCGIGYAISMNQIKNFLGHLRAGIETDHATLGAAVASASEDGDLAKMVVSSVLDESDAFRRGVQETDQLISFAARPLTSVNQYKNILGIFPRDWRMPLVYARGNERKETLVRLMGYQPALEQKKGPDQPQPIVGKKDTGPQGEGAKFYKPKKGFANYYFNEQAQKRVLEGFTKLGDFSGVRGDWLIEGSYEKEKRTGDLKFNIVEEKVVGTEKETRTIIRANLNTDYQLEPLKANQMDKDLMVPPYSGGLLMAMFHWNRFLTLGPKGFDGTNGFFHGGSEPIYVQPITGNESTVFKDIRVMAEVIRTEYAGVAGKWYFYRSDLNPQLKDRTKYKDYELIAFEIFVAHDQDPCEIYLHESKEINGRLLPTKMEVRHGDKRYSILSLRDIKMAATPK